MSQRLRATHARMTPGAQRGLALILLLLILTVTGLWFLFGRMNTSPEDLDIERRKITASALAEAKRALLGYVAAEAASDKYPGRLPCPEALGYAQNADPSDDGKAGGPCTAPAVGRFPWRTLGLDKLTDGYGEPLWYVVSPGFALPGASMSVNIDTPSQLTVDGVGGAMGSTAPHATTPNPQGVVALIIAPGAPVNVQASANCAAKVQVRDFPASLSDVGNYLECQNATPANKILASSGPAGSFNDQVVRLTHQELFNAVEPVVLKRIEKEIVPGLKAVYASSDWNTSATNPVFPFAVNFDDPTTTNFLGGLSPTNKGLLPLFRSASDASQIVWYTSSGTYPPSVTKQGEDGDIWGTPVCSGTTSTMVSCAVTYNGKLEIRIKAGARRVGRSLRVLDPSAVPVGTWAHPSNPKLKVSAEFIPTSTSGAAWIYVDARLPDRGSAYGTVTVTVPIDVLKDHPLTDPNDATTGWFVGNNWHHLIYYAFAARFAPNGTPPRNCAGANCLTVQNTSPANNKRAILIYAGRALGEQRRPLGSGILSAFLPGGSLATNATWATWEPLANYLDCLGPDPAACAPPPASTETENWDGASPFVNPAVTKTINDRFIVVDQN